ncbi:PREDICTED: leucine-rich repeat and coiled-coil domain-containing protein 1-like, partial [Priapulus caudatus]|uniref:Leucine-rich repeat and coiled-coil domain-containing protein 1-like n=1 Tax=Priapulus caudatus TaxID=37621 RepID=A0ABM1EWW9_PRICU
MEVSVSTTTRSYIDADIKNIDDVKLQPQLQSLSMHCNSITRITGLAHLYCLTHLDLSSNAIDRLDGLGNLCSLQALNVACNRLEAVSGLEGLRRLLTINLSYNRITDIGGFRGMGGNTYSMAQVILHGNKLADIDHLVHSLQACVKLHTLTLVCDKSANPVCSTMAYRRTLLESMTNLLVLDGYDRTGRTIANANSTQFQLGTHISSDLLLGRRAEASNAVITPRIDVMLENLRDARTSAHIVASSTDAAQVHGEGGMDGERDLRLDKLELQLASLLVKQASSRQPASSQRGTPPTNIAPQRGRPLARARRDSTSGDDEEESTVAAATSLERSLSPGGAVGSSEAATS